jgi:hypothetical protein
MNPDALDDLARQVAATPTSRRAMLKAVAVGALLGLPGRTSKHRLPPARAVSTGSDPVCNWSGAALDCLNLGLSGVACYAKCSGGKIRLVVLPASLT